MPRYLARVIQQDAQRRTRATFNVPVDAESKKKARKAIRNHPGAYGLRTPFSIGKLWLQEQPSELRTG